MSEASASDAISATGDMRYPSLLVIAGGTATGKTDLSLAIADAVGDAEIISADSRQVYREMDIGTAKVSVAERERVPHHGLDLVDPDELFTAADFQRHVYGVLPGIAARGHLAILVGGTGLYLRSVGRGVPFDAADADPAIRAELEARLADGGVAPLVAELQAIAPDLAAHTHLANPRRVVRALERARIVGDRLPEPPRGYPAATAWIGLRRSRTEQDARIEARATRQFAAGLIDEAVGLRARYGIHPRAFSAFGYFEALAVADGEIDTPTAVGRDIGRTRAYARRQATWFRSEPGIGWLDATDSRSAGIEAARRLVG
ncbi:MAG TPA: tRNA (adenosine(37)-N6)-dimethylallyltransferase MiaA [Candidatus Saccharimonadia bacterium]|nr:tRNA (adenosine(37)-N6)-dimethylallyltransferase MiaA [Candidatus Saccharimonadia bacterium]